jgi:hypothetical protein
MSNAQAKQLAAKKGATLVWYTNNKGEAKLAQKKAAELRKQNKVAFANRGHVYEVKQ